MESEGVGASAWIGWREQVWRGFQSVKEHTHTHSLSLALSLSLSLLRPHTHTHKDRECHTYTTLQCPTPQARRHIQPHTSSPSHTFLAPSVCLCVDLNRGPRPPLTIAHVPLGPSLTPPLTIAHVPFDHRSRPPLTIAHVPLTIAYAPL